MRTYKNMFFLFLRNENWSKMPVFYDPELFDTLSLPSDTLSKIKIMKTVLYRFDLKKQQKKTIKTA